MFGIARTIPSPSWSVCRYPSSTNLHTLSHALTPMQLPQNRAPKATITDLVGSARRPRSFTIALACFPGSLPLLRQFAHDVLLGFEATKQQKKTTLADLLIARPQYFEVQLQHSTPYPVPHFNHVPIRVHPCLSWPSCGRSSGSVGVSYGQSSGSAHCSSDLPRCASLGSSTRSGLTLHSPVVVRMILTIHTTVCGTCVALPCPRIVYQEAPTAGRTGWVRVKRSTQTSTTWAIP